MPTRQDQIAGGLVGLLVGDALGVPYEFHPPQNLPPIASIEFEPPRGFARTYPAIAIGTWSDDGAQALCLLASLLDCDRLDPEDLGQRLLKWYDHGYMAVDNHVFDVGGQTSRALEVLRRGIPAVQAGSTDERSKGNGSLMRVLPLALWHQGSDAELIADAQQQSQVTHGHVTVQVCCALYCLWGRRMLAGIPDAWQDAVNTLRHHYGADSEERSELEDTIRPDQPAAGEGSGYVVDCLHSARWALQAGEYERVVKAAVSLGNDTDTTACVAGGIAGLRDGVNAIPERWRDRLRGEALLQPLLAGLLQRHQSD